MPKEQRLSREELSFHGPRRRLHGALFSLSISPLPTGRSKGACVVSKKIAPKAHDRNLLKRRCREVLRTHLSRLKKPQALVLQAKKAAQDAPFASVREDIENLLQSLE